MVHISTNKSLRPMLLFGIAIVIGSWVSALYGMKTSDAAIEKKSFHDLPVELQEIILAPFFTKKLQYHGGEKLKCTAAGEYYCWEKKCFFHGMTEKERYADVSGTLQLSIQYSNMRSAADYIAWYEFGRIRKNPNCVEAMRTPDDWQNILLTSELCKSSSIVRNSYCTTVESSLQSYKRPIRSHYARLHSPSDSFNQIPYTGYWDFSLLLQPTISVPVRFSDRSSTYSGPDAIWLSDSGETLIHHAFGQGYSTGYSLETKEKKWEVSYASDQYNTAVYGDKSFPLIIGGRKGIFFTEDSLKPGIILYSEPVRELVLSVDNSIIWGFQTYDGNAIIAIEIKKLVAKKFQLEQPCVFDEAEILFYGLYPHPYEVNQVVVVVTADEIRDSRNQVWKAFELSLSTHQELALQRVEYDNTKVMVKSRERYINNWKEHGTEQFFRRERVIWRDQAPRENTYYNTIYTENHPANEFYYVDGDISGYNEKYNAIYGRKDNCVCVWYTLPRDMTVPERMIVESTRINAAEWDENLNKEFFFYKGFISSQADRLCTTLECTSNNKNNVDRISKIIRDNVVTPSILGAIKLAFQSNVHYFGTGLPVWAVFGVCWYRWLVPFSDTSKTIFMAGVVGAFGLWTGYILHHLWSNTRQKRRLVENTGECRILYVPAQYNGSRRLDTKIEHVIKEKSYTTHL